MARKKSTTEDKSIRLGDLRFQPQTTTDQATLEANANFDGGVGADNGKRAVCYNRGCPDYRVERPASQKCGCAKTSVEAK